MIIVSILSPPSSPIRFYYGHCHYGHHYYHLVVLYYRLRLITW